MSETVQTVGGALALDQAAGERLASAATRRGKLGEISRELLSAVMSDVAAALATGVQEALAVPIPAVLASGWGRYVELRKFCDPERYPPDRVSIVALAPHKVTSRHAPRVELEIGGVLPVPVRVRLELGVELAAKVEGAKVAIQAGKIRKLLCGTVEVGVALFYGDDEIASRESRFTLPGEFSFGEGIPIAPAIPLGGDIPIAGAPPAPAARTVAEPGAGPG